MHTRITRIASGGLRIDDAQCGTRHATVRRRVVIRPVRLQRAAAYTLLPRRGVLYGPSLTQYTRSCRAISVCVCYIARRATPVGTHSQVPRRAIVAAFDVSTRRARHGDEIGGRFGRTRHTPTWQGKDSLFANIPQACMHGVTFTRAVDAEGPFERASRALYHHCRL